MGRSITFRYMYEVGNGAGELGEVLANFWVSRSSKRMPPIQDELTAISVDDVNLCTYLANVASLSLVT